jgi:hypothetical protein
MMSTIQNDSIKILPGEMKEEDPKPGDIFLTEYRFSLYSTMIIIDGEWSPQGYTGETVKNDLIIILASEATINNVIRTMYVLTPKNVGWIVTECVVSRKVTK